MQRQFDGLGVIDLDRSAVLPVPLCAFGSEGRLQCLAVDEKLEFSRCLAFGIGPAGDPVLRACEHVPRSLFRKLNFGGSVSDGRSETVGEKVGRSHFPNELGVQLPAAVVGEAFGFDEKFSRLQGGGEGQKGKERGFFDHREKV